MPELGVDESLNWRNSYCRCHPERARCYKQSPRDHALFVQETSEPLEPYGRDFKPCARVPTQSGLVRVRVSADCSPGFLVQCNLQQLQPDQLVTIMRNGIPIGEAKVMRSQAGLCTIHMQSGDARRFDTVFLPQKAAVVQPERGPAIPAFYGSPATSTAAPAPRTAPAAQSNFWNTLQTNGRVYNLNTGETLSP